MLFFPLLNLMKLVCRFHLYVESKRKQINKPNKTETHSQKDVEQMCGHYKGWEELEQNKRD